MPTSRTSADSNPARDMCCALVIASPLVLGSNAAAQDSESSSSTNEIPVADGADVAAAGERPPAPFGRGELTFKAGVWFPRLGGLSSLGTGAPELDFDLDLSLRDAEPTPNFEVIYVRRDGWKMHLDVFQYEGTDTVDFVGSSSFGSVSLQTGDTVKSDVSISSLGAELHLPSIMRYEDDPDVDFRISPILGLRVAHTRQVVEEVGVAREEYKVDAPAPMFGASLDLAWKVNEQLPLLHRVDIAAGTSFGPALSGDGGSMWHVRADITLSFTANVGLLFGYRLLELDLEDGDYMWDAGLQGLFVGAMLRF
ncbi:MAG: hypothetical protein ACYTF9_06100 [Planctomycetota bacterium]|jgi:hypothetical protein